MPRPQARATRNDQSVLDAALTLADEIGWSGLVPGRVAEAAGLSRGAVLARHADRSAIGAALWRERIGGPLLDNWARLVEVADAATGSGLDLQAAMEPFLHPDQTMRAAAELILVGRYDPAVAEALTETVGDQLASWTTPGRGAINRTRAAQRAFVLGLAHGYLIEARRHHTMDIDLSGELTRLARALATPSAPVRQPTAQAAYLDARVDFGTGEPMVEAVLSATLDLVGKVGYDATTIEAITEAAGYTRSVIFNRYPSKRDLFIDASDRMLEGALALNDEYQERIAATHGIGVAEACLLREFLRPSRDAMRTITFEQIRLSWGDPDLLASIDASLIEHQHALTAELARPPAEMRAMLVTELALGHGIVTLQHLQPAIWQLPLDVVLVPFRA